MRPQFNIPELLLLSTKILIVTTNLFTHSFIPNVIYEMLRQISDVCSNMKNYDLYEYLAYNMSSRHYNALKAGKGRGIQWCEELKVISVHLVITIQPCNKNEKRARHTWLKWILWLRNIHHIDNFFIALVYTLCLL